MSAAQKPPLPTDNVDERPGLPVRVLRGSWRAVTSLRHNRIMALVLLSGLGMMACSAGSVVFYYLGPGATRDAEHNIVRALAALDAGKYADARQLVMRRWRTAALPPAYQGYPLIILGQVLAHEAEQPGREADRAALYLLAARYLQEAQRSGVPVERQRRIAFELARCLFHSGRYAESLPALQAAIEQNPDDAPRLWRWLATAYRCDTVPQLRPALAALQRALESPHLAPNERDEATVEQGLIQFQLGDVAGCRASLAQLAPASPVAGQASILEARCRIADGDRLRGAAADAAAATDAYQRAVAILEQELAGDRTNADRTDTVQRSARYLLGVAHRQLGDIPAAREAYGRTRRLHPGSDEGLAATLDEADLLQGTGHVHEALDLYVAVAREAPAPGAYGNPWVTLPELQARLQAALHRFQTARQFAAAVTLCARLRPLLPADALTEVEAQTLEAWGDWLIQPDGGGTGPGGVAQQAQGRARFRAAADAYQRLAALRLATPHYPQDLWKSGSCFLRGHNFAAAIPVLHRYLDCAPRRQHAPSLLGLGECHLALGHFHQALDALRECIELFPKHPETYRARLLASQACAQLGQIPEAKQLLVDNLHNSELTPQSIPWQHSLFAYGQLLFTAAKAEDAAARTAPVDGREAARGQAPGDRLSSPAQQFAEARRALQEAVARYPDAEPAPRARYSIAESWRYAARLAETSLRDESAPTRRRQLQEQRHRDLAAAAEGYRQLQAANDADDNLSLELPAVDRRIRRNARLAYASALYDLEAFPAAIQAYADAARQHQDEPVAVEALARLAHCYRRTQAPEQAREAVTLARATLDRVAADADFTRTTRHSQEGWRNLLDWLAQL